MEFAHLRVEDVGGIAVVEMNRPSVNALGTELLRELIAQELCTFLHARGF